MAKTLNCTDMADLLGLSPRHLQRLAKLEVVPTVSKRPYKFEPKDAIQAYIAYIKSGGEQTGDKLRKLKAEADYREAKAEKERLELEELRLEMHRAEDVQTCFEAFAGECRAAFLSLPGRVAVDVSQTRTAAEAAAVVQRVVNDTLDTLSQWEYDKDYFRQLVKKREKRNMLADELEEQ